MASTPYERWFCRFNSVANYREWQKLDRTPVRVGAGFGGDPPPPDPDPVTTMLMGCSDSQNTHGGTNVWDGWRTYRRSPMYTIANRTGNLKPKFLAYSEDGPNIGGTNPVYNTVYNYVRNELDIFYYTSAGSNTPNSQRQDIKLYWSNGNENHDKGALEKAQSDNTPHTDAQVANYLTSMRALYDAVHYAPGGSRKYPNAFAGSNPTHDAEGRGIVQKWLHATAHYHDFIMWSMYPPGRKQTEDNPTYNFPSYNDSATVRANAQQGFMIRCFYRTNAARAAARVTLGNPNFDLSITCGEVGIGDNPSDTTTRPYYAVHGLAYPMTVMAEQYQLEMPFACWWDNQTNAGSPQNILGQGGTTAEDNVPTTGEPLSTNPSTREAWQNWRDYCHVIGGTHPASWASNPKSSWKTTGTVI